MVCHEKMTPLGECKSKICVGGVLTPVKAAPKLTFVLGCVVILISGSSCCDKPMNFYFLSCALCRSNR